MSSVSSVVSALEETVAAIGKVYRGPAPKVGVILGSGLGGFADTIGNLQKISYSELPHLPSSKVVGHAGNLCFGTVGDIPVVCMQGRIHLYEGHPVRDVVHGARTMAKLGVKTVLVTNAAGGLVADWAAGDLMRVTDHLNLTGHTPLLGPNEDALGTRFPDMSRAYDPALGEALVAVAKEAGIELREGIYAALMGPSYETPAEVRMLRGLGAHAVGMSTVPEVIALRHMGIRVGALSCITNLAAGITGAELNHAEVEETAKAKRAQLLALLDGWTRAAGQMDK